MRTLIIPILLCCCLCSYSQELSFKQLTVKDGLPGAVVYQALQDKNGFIWFATNQGVSRFDGRTFTNYFREDGLPDNEIIKLYLDRHNNIWFISLLGIPSVYHNGAITRFDHCTGVTSICEDRLTDSIVLIAEQNRGNKGFRGYYSAGNTPGKWQFTSHFKPDDWQLLQNWPILRSSSTQKISFYFSIYDALNYSISVKDKGTEKQYLFKRYGYYHLPFSTNAFSTLTADKKGIVFHTPDSIYYCNAEKIYPVISLHRLGLMPFRNDDLNSLYCENDSTLWVCTRNLGLLCIRNFLTPRFTVHSYFTSSSCTAIIKDEENGYWVTTHGEGVFHLPDMSFHTLSDMTAKNALCIRASGNNTITAGFADGNIIRVNTANMSSRQLPNRTVRNNRILEIWPLANGGLLAGSDRSLQLLDQGMAKDLITTDVKAIYVQRDSTILLGTSRGMIQTKLNGGAKRVLLFNRITCLTGFDGQYYWGTMHGVYTRSNGVVHYLGRKYPALAGIIHHLDIAPDTALWISTQQGVAILKDSVLTFIKKEQGLPSNTCKHVSFDKNTAWVSTNKGITRIDYHWRKGGLAYTLSNITEDDGLATDEVNQTLPMGNYVWAATARGISYFPKSYVSHSTVRPLINISRIAAGNETLPVTDTIVLGPKKNKLQIELSGISYRSGKQIHYEYRLKELDNNWNNITNNTIEFPALPFGRFTFEVRAVDRWREKSDSPKSIIIINDPPFWKTNGFLLCVYLLSFILTALGFYEVYRRVMRKREDEYYLKKRMHDLEVMALRAQMNPHFIFNCLTSIQYYLMQADVRNAHVYLHKFSILIRKILQHSTTSVISLKDELRILELYLELEELRLGRRMKYHVDVSDNIRQEDILIPAMIIQPYVENAVKHGIAPLEGRQGILNIKITRSDNYIECIIEDNGPGMPAILQNNNNTKEYGHVSLGTGITVNRINTIN
ncbi:MAG TPA: histidine kinase, partial [Chitinophaga sp.]|nr:histidine kinase [Chitinophaga sp.]